MTLPIQIAAITRSRNNGRTAFLESVEHVLLFLLFFTCSTSQRISFDSFSIGWAEVIALLYILWRCVTGGSRDERAERGARWLIRGLFAMAGWAGMVWILSANWENRRMVTFNWLLALPVFLCLLRSPVRDWRRLAQLMVLAALPNVILGIVQHVLGIGLAPKDLSGWGKEATSSPVTGLFQHSNDLALYLYWPFLLSIGLSFAFRGVKRLVYTATAVLLAVTLYWSFSRSILITLTVLAVLLTLAITLSRKRIFLVILAAGTALAVLALVWIVQTHSYGEINRLLSGRLTLWERTLQLISEDPLYLPLGYLIPPPDGTRVFWLPHNVYLLFWVEFGWFGLFLLVGGAVYLLREGWMRYEKLRAHKPAAVVWLGWAGIFAVDGLVSLSVHETHFILSLLGIAVIWRHLLREIDTTSP
jgi:O-antigen ligase